MPEYIHLHQAKYESCSCTVVLCEELPRVVRRGGLIFKPCESVWVYPTPRDLRDARAIEVTCHSRVFCNSWVANFPADSERELAPHPPNICEYSANRGHSLEGLYEDSDPPESPRPGGDLHVVSDLGCA